MPRQETVEIAVVVAILVYMVYKLYFKPEKHTSAGEVYESGDVQQHIERYLVHRLEAVRKEADFSEGFMQALGNVSHISPVGDKIRDLDAKFEKLKDEEFKIMSVLRKVKNVSSI